MKKKKFYIIGVILLLLITIGCSFDATSGKLSKEDLEKVENTTYEDVVKNLTDEVEDFIKEHEYYTLTKIEFDKDDLAVDPENKVKKFNNIDMKVGIEVNSEEAPTGIEANMATAKMKKKFEEKMEIMNDDLLEILNKERPIEYAKVGYIEILNKDRNYELEYDFDALNTRESEAMLYLRNEKSKDEKIVLEKTFEQIKEIRYELKRFGVVENVLMIGFDLEEVESGKDMHDIAKISNDIHNLALNDEKIKEYISKRKIRTINIAFNRSEDEKPIVYKYRVK